MKQSESISKLALALVAVQSELTSVTKDSVNPHFKSRYASLDAIIEATRPVLAKHGLAVVQGAIESEGGYLSVETMVVHSSGEWLSGGISLPMGKADPQGAGAAMTYGRRFGLAALLSLATDEDDDGNAASRPRQAKQSKPSDGGAHSGAAVADQSVATASARPSEPKLFFGRPAGTPLGEYDNEQLKAMLSWAVSKQATKQDAKMQQKIQTIRAILADRSLGQPTTQAEMDAVAVSRLADKPDSLPF